MQGTFSSRESPRGFTGMLPTNAARLGCKAATAWRALEHGAAAAWLGSGWGPATLPASQLPLSCMGPDPCSLHTLLRTRARAASAASDGSESQPQPARALGGTAHGQGGKIGTVYFGRTREE